MNGGRCSSAVLGTPVTTTTGGTDMIPLLDVDAGRVQSFAACGASVLLSGDTLRLFGSPSVALADVRPAESLTARVPFKGESSTRNGNVKV